MSSVRFHIAGKLLYVLLDAATEYTWVSPITDPSKPVVTDLAKMLLDTDINASGGPVHIAEVRFPRKYPFVRLDLNQVKACFRLSRRICHDETVTISLPEGLFVQDGVSSAALVDAVPVKMPNFYPRGELRRLIKPGCRVVYIDPDNGDDEAAASVGGVGYYTYTGEDSVVGEEPTDPVGSPVAYETLTAAQGVVPANTHCAVLMRRGSTIDGAVSAMHSAAVLESRRGEARDRPYIFETWGDGDGRVLIQPLAEAGDGPGLPVRHFNNATDGGNIVFGWGLELVPGYAGEAFTMFSPRHDRVHEDDYTGYLWLGCKIPAITWQHNSFSNMDRFKRDLGFVRCAFGYDGGTGNGGIWECNGGSEIWGFREVSVEEFTIMRYGHGGGYHGFYVKTFSDLSFLEGFNYDGSGCFLKCDNNWGVHVSDCVITMQYVMCNPESNGPSPLGLPEDRSKDTTPFELPDLDDVHGGHSRWVTVERSVMTDMQTARGANLQALIYRFGPAQDCSVVDNIAILDGVHQSLALTFTTGLGSNTGYGRDSHGNEMSRNTVVLTSGGSGGHNGVTVPFPLTDEITPEDNHSRGHHDVRVDRNLIAYVGNYTGTHRCFATSSAITWAAGEALGRGSGIVSRNCFWSVAGEAGRFADGGESLPSVGELESRLNAQTPGTAFGNRFEDPGFVLPGYRVSDHAVTSGYADLDAFATAMEAALLGGGEIPEPLRISSITAAVLGAHVPAGLDASNYDGQLPGAGYWIDGEPPLPTPFLRFTDENGAPLKFPLARDFEQSDTPATETVWLRVINGALAGANLQVSAGPGAAVIEYRNQAGDPIADLAAISVSESSPLGLVIALDRSDELAGSKTSLTVSDTSETVGAIAASWVVTVSATPVLSGTHLYDSAVVPNPGADRQSPSVMVDLSLMSDLWWDAVDTADATKGRATNGDGDPLACDWLTLDAEARAGWLRVRWSGILASEGEHVLRVYPPKSERNAVAADDEFGAYAAHDLEAYWPLDQDFRNRTADQYHCVPLLPGQATDEPGAAGSAAAFNGEDDRLAIGDGFTLGGRTEVTAMGWIKNAKATGAGTPFWAVVIGQFSVSSQRPFSLRMRGSNRSMCLEVNNDPEVYSAALIPEGAWAHVAGVKRADKLEVYVNGELSGELEYAQPTVNAANACYIGNHQSGGMSAPHGGLDEIRVYGTAVTAADIKHEYEQVADPEAFWGGGWTPTVLPDDAVLTARINGTALVPGVEVGLGVFAPSESPLAVTMYLRVSAGSVTFGEIAKFGPWVTINEDVDPSGLTWTAADGEAPLGLLLNMAVTDELSDGVRQAAISVPIEGGETLQFGIRWEVRSGRAVRSARVRASRMRRATR